MSGKYIFEIIELICLSCKINGRHFLCKYYVLKSIRSTKREEWGYDPIKISAAAHFWVISRQLRNTQEHEATLETVEADFTQRSWVLPPLVGAAGLPRILV